MMRVKELKKVLVLYGLKQKKVIKEKKILQFGLDPKLT
jgi:hypothetical protein